jgi:NADH-quinone oxidoreductase subunit G
MVTVTIQLDGDVVEAEAGSNLLAVLLDAGHAVPHPCFHPSLSAPASCRMCLAMEEGPEGRRLITTCNRTVQAGQRLFLQDPQVETARSALVDDVLLRHPPQCSVCERTGECELQEVISEQGDGTTRATQAHSGERVELGPRLVLDRKRCILCTRCVRFEAEVSGSHGLTVSGSGANAVVDTCATVPEQQNPLHHELSGNLLDLCPAGALVEPGEQFRPPAWQMTGISSVCPGCSSGCATRIDIAAGRVQRVKPRGDGDDAQGYWLCDTGRYGWQADISRLQAPKFQGQVVEWDVALAEVAERMEQAKKAAVLLSPYQSNEEIFLLANLALRWNADLFFWESQHPEGDLSFPSGFTISGQRGPNHAGLAAVAAALKLPLGDEAQLAALLSAGELDALYAVGGSQHGEGPQLRTSADLFLALQDLTQPGWAANAEVVMPCGSAWTEKDGTFIDRHQRLQRVREAVQPPEEARPDFWILAALWHGGPNRDSPDETFSRLARCSAEGPFARMDYGILESQSSPARGVAYGGGWSSHLQRRGIIAVEDHAKRQ